MLRRTKNLPFLLLAMSLLSLLCSLPPAARADGEIESPPIRIGMVSTLFTDVPSPFVQFILQPFGAIMKQFTGMNGKMVLGGDALALAKDLHEGKVDLAVYHGVEYAWVKARYKDLKPLMIACTKYTHAQAVLVVRKDGPVKSVANLRGKSVALPQRSREHCRLFMCRAGSETGRPDAPLFYSKILTPTSVEGALDEVCDKLADAAVVDLVAFENYESLKPGCFSHLKVLRPSERFPTGVIVYRDGTLPESTLNTFRKGLAGAHKTEQGRESMSMFKITSFEPVPADYDQMLADIIKIYPPPAGAAR